MKLSEYKAGQWVNQYHYKSFYPSKVNHEWSLDNDSVIYMLSRANGLLGELKAFSKQVPDVDFFIKMHIIKEATTSSKIEGTQTNIDEAVQKVENIHPEKVDDWVEVQNYTQAINYAIDELDNLPLCNRLLRHTHKILMQGVRGQNKQPGEFRTSQNWIGGSSINNATFVPPNHNELPELMSDLELFLENKNFFVPPLIKIAIAHYQFEVIHPFLDGNGRIGRLLITLFLVNENILYKPTLYLSDFFVNHRSLYYENLSNVSTKDNMTQWLKFFLDGVIQTAEKSISTLDQIINLKIDIEKDVILNFGKNSQKANELFIHLFSHPVVDANDVCKELKISNNTALRLISKFVKRGILEETTGFKRNRIFCFEKYLCLFR